MLSQRKPSQNKINISNLQNLVPENSYVQLLRPYNEEDIYSYLNYQIQSKLGGYTKGSTFLLAGQTENGTFKDEQADTNSYKYNEHYYVCVTPPVDLDHTSIDYFFDKEKQKGFKEGNTNSCKDVMDEVLPLLSANTQNNVKVLFPCKISQHLWVTCEVRFQLRGQGCFIYTYMHEPRRKQIEMNKFLSSAMQELEETIRAQFKKAKSKYQLHYERTCVSFPNSPNEDVISSGVGMVEDLLARIQGINLSKQDVYVPGAENFRLRHIGIMQHDSQFKKRNTYCLETAGDNMDLGASKISSSLTIQDEEEFEIHNQVAIDAVKNSDKMLLEIILDQGIAEYKKEYYVIERKISYQFLTIDLLYFSFEALKLQKEILESHNIEKEIKVLPDILQVKLDKLLNDWVSDPEHNHFTRHNLSLNKNVAQSNAKYCLEAYWESAFRYPLNDKNLEQLKKYRHSLLKDELNRQKFELMNNPDGVKLLEKLKM